MRFGAIVESHDAPAEADEEVGTERDESPKGELINWAKAHQCVSVCDGEGGGGMKGEREGRDGVPQGRFHFG